MDIDERPRRASVTKCGGEHPYTQLHCKNVTRAQLRSAQFIDIFNLVGKHEGQGVLLYIFSSSSIFLTFLVRF